MSIIEWIYIIANDIATAAHAIGVVKSTGFTTVTLDEATDNGMNGHKVFAETVFACK